MGEHDFSKSKRLLNASEYSAVFAAAEFKVSDKNLLFLARHNAREDDRLGLVIAKKNVRLAVQRNRIKRIIRESFRHQTPTLSGCDVVVLARRGLDGLDSPEIACVLSKMWQKLAGKRALSCVQDSPEAIQVDTQV